MQENSNFIYNRLTQFSARACGMMYNQVNLLAVNTKLLLTELANEITFEQERHLKDNLKIARFVKRQIANYQSTCNHGLKLLHQPAEVIWEKINLHSAIKETVDMIEKYDVEGFSKLVTIDMDKEILIHSMDQLLFTTLENLFIWIHLLAPTNHIFVNLTQNETDIFLKISGHDNPSLEQIDIISQETAYFSKETVEFIVSILGGSFNWKQLEVVPGQSELIIQFPQNSPKEIDHNR